jgi:hypothetical protein
MKLKPKDPAEYRLKSKRTSDTKNVPLERRARGTVTASSEILFQVKFSNKTKREQYNKPKTEYPELDEEEKKETIVKRPEFLLFRKKDSLPEAYHKPNVKTVVDCIYHGDKNALFPYKVLDTNRNLLWEENN